MTGTDKTSEDEQQPVGKLQDSDTSEPVEYLWMRYGYRLVLISLFVVAGIFVITYGVSILWLEEVASELHAPMSSVTGVIGTLVGAFFGHQLGAAGKERANVGQRFLVRRKSGRRAGC